MNMLYPYQCCNEVSYKGAALYGQIVPFAKNFLKLIINFVEIKEVTETNWNE